jgi:hypothetical protein
MDWIQMAKYRAQWWVLMNMVMSLSGVIKGREFLDLLSDC